MNFVYSAELTISRVQSEIKSKKLVQKIVLEECGVSENTLKKMTDKRGISSFSLAKIADCLECSVDYLLGRTDNPKLREAAVLIGDISNISNNSGIVGSVNSSISSIDGSVSTLVDIYNKLEPVEQAKLLVYADELLKNKH